MSLLGIEIFHRGADSANPVATRTCQPSPTGSDTAADAGDQLRQPRLLGLFAAC